MTNSTINFKKAELKAYPLLPKLEVGLQGVALEGTNYEGLKGSITEIRYGVQKETENDSVVEIVMDFEEPEYGSLEDLYPQLNGTGIDQLIMDEECVGFFFDEKNPALTLEGKIVCPSCHKPLDAVRETQYDDITWTFENGEYMKSNSGSSDGKKCPECVEYIEADEDLLGY